MIQKLKEWSAESERAVSPVIGVILMVAITVILAAVIGSFVLGIGGDINETPQVRLGVSDNPGNTPDGSGNAVVDVTHNGGDALSVGDLEFIVAEGGTQYTGSASVSEITVGDRVTLDTFEDSGGTPLDVSGSVPVEVQFRIVHEPSDSILLDTTVTVE